MPNSNITREQADRDLGEAVAYACKVAQTPLGFLSSFGYKAVAVASQAGAEYALATGLDLNDPPENAIRIAESLQRDGVQWYPYCGETRRKALAAGEDPTEAIEWARAFFYADDPTQDGIAPEEG